MIRRFTLGLVVAGASCRATDEFEQGIVDATALPGKDTASPLPLQFRSALYARDLSATRTIQHKGVSPTDMNVELAQGPADMSQRASPYAVAPLKPAGTYVSLRWPSPVNVCLRTAVTLFENIDLLSS
ncbi:MAG: hypothetical protein AAFN74_11510 [Myxococcota bacterium]